MPAEHLTFVVQLAEFPGSTSILRGILQLQKMKDIAYGQS